MMLLVKVAQCAMHTVRRLYNSSIIYIYIIKLIKYIHVHLFSIIWRDETKIAICIYIYKCHPKIII